MNNLFRDELCLLYFIPQDLKTQTKIISKTVIEALSTAYVLYTYTNKPCLNS